MVPSFSSYTTALILFLEFLPRVAAFTEILAQVGVLGNERDILLGGGGEV